MCSVCLERIVGIVQPQHFIQFIIPLLVGEAGAVQKHQTHGKGALGSCFSKLFCKQVDVFKYSHWIQWIYWGAAPSWDLTALGRIHSQGPRLGLEWSLWKIKWESEGNHSKWCTSTSSPRHWGQHLHLPSPQDQGTNWNWDGDKLLRQTGNCEESQLSLPLGLWQPRLCLPTELCDNTHCSLSILFL